MTAPEPLHSHGHLVGLRTSRRLWLPMWLYRLACRRAGCPGWQTAEHSLRHQAEHAAFAERRALAT